jgi:hypothetical protein
MCYAGMLNLVVPLVAPNSGHSLIGRALILPIETIYGLQKVKAYNLTSGPRSCLSL